MLGYDPADIPVVSGGVVVEARFGSDFGSQWQRGYDVGTGQVRLEGEKLSDRVRVAWRCIVGVVGVVGKNGQDTEMFNLLRTHRVSKRPSHATLLPSQRSRAGE
jgi:hypothetical protein